MDAKAMLVISLAVIVLVMGGCFGNVGGGASSPEGPHSATGAVPELAEGTKACYADAQQQLSPQWANASTLDRAVAAFTVISVCEGNQP